MWKEGFENQISHWPLFRAKFALISFAVFSTIKKLDFGHFHLPRIIMVWKFPRQSFFLIAKMERWLNPNSEIKKCFFENEWTEGLKNR